MRLALPGSDDTLALGALLGRALAELSARGGKPCALLLCGPLGSGKTTLMRGLVGALPGAEGAEVSSPSFNIVNSYPTKPPVAHFDLYRVAGGVAPEELLDALDAPDVLVAAEWMENLPQAEWPQEALVLTWQPQDSGRALEIRAWGKAASGLLESLAPAFNHWQLTQKDCSR